MTDQNQETPWYKEGLRFKCTGCGKCCTGAPGYVWITKAEIEAMATHLKVRVEEFVRKYVRQRFDRYALIEMKANNYDCVFLKDKKCLVYPVRPKQCRTFPWWKENLTSPQSWQLAAMECEGICSEAPLVSYAHIDNELNS